MSVCMREFLKRIGMVCIIGALVISVLQVEDVGAASKKPILSKKKVYVDVGSKIKISVKKNGYKINSIAWGTDNESVAKVSKKGVITGVGEGKTSVKAIIIAKNKKKKLKSFILTCKVVVCDWKRANDPTITPEIVGFIDTINSSSKEYKYEPVALLATLDNLGVKYRVFCRKSSSASAETVVYTMLEFLVDARGTVSITKDKTIKMDSFPKTSEEEGGWAECRDPKGFDQDDAHNAACQIEDSGNTYSYNAIAKIGEQIIDSKNKRWCIICERYNWVNKSKPEYCILYVKVKYDWEVGWLPTHANDNKIVLVEYI